MEFELKGKQYRTSALGVFDQLKVSRKLLPVIADMLGELKNGETSLLDALPKIAQTIAALKDEDCDAILFPCLAVARRKQGNHWTPVFDPSSDTLMFDDLELMDVLHIVANVVGESLGNFFHDLPGSVTAAPSPL
ncbi:phage tail assembly chaperone [Sodalis ligni]|uniref:Bacteriophage protein n=1 Tax=Sodalis ligni TaxID=2697027 RepID=A0A4R1NBW4_9GAMM|nr:hypothetical protein [Sodalis ligni]TCL04219.1 hypothetical protein EZJ58_2331 [Sodalis ligni]